MTTQPQITSASLALFLELAEDASNWGGAPPFELAKQHGFEIERVTGDES